MSELASHSTDELSALMDGELSGSQKDRTLSQLLSNEQAQATWHAYHVLGDVLRSDALAEAGADRLFWARLEARLTQEPGIPGKGAAAVASTEPSPQAGLRRSANADSFKWGVLAGTACTVLLAVVAVMVWMPRTPSALLAASPGPAQVAAADSQANTAVLAPDGMIRDPRLDQLLSAHQQLGGHSALQMPSGFLRNATYEGGGR